MLTVLQGMDSLMALTCRSNLIALSSVTHRDPELPKNLLYHHPTIESLFNFMTANVSVEILEDSNSITSLQASLSAIMQKLNFSPPTSPREGFIVLLTGSTGTFGSQLLTQMLQSPKISTVYCLNRRNSHTPISVRQRKHMDDPTILEAYAPKVKFLDMDVTEDYLGLTWDSLTEVCTTAQ